MWFVIVNGRVLPHMHGYPRRCTFCCEPIGESYLREIATKLPYCSLEHYVQHCKLAETKLLEYSA